MLTGERLGVKHRFTDAVGPASRCETYVSLELSAAAAFDGIMERELFALAKIQFWAQKIGDAVGLAHRCKAHARTGAVGASAFSRSTND